MIETPVSSSPAMIARSTGAAPRQRGSSDGCTLTSSWSLSSGSLISAPNAQTTTASGCGGGDPRPRVVGVDRLGLVDLDAQLARRVGDRRRAERAPAALRRVRAGHDQRRAMRAAGEPLEHGRGEVGGPEVDGSQAASRASRRARIASLRWSLRGAVEDQHAVEVVDLVLDHARLEPGGLDDDVLAVLVLRAHADVDRPLDLDVHGRQAQAALLGPLLLVAATTRSPG